MRNTINLTEEKIKNLTQTAYQKHNNNPNSKNKSELFFMIGRMSILQEKWYDAIKWFGEANCVLIESSLKEDLELYYWTGVAYLNIGEVEKTRLVIQKILASVGKAKVDLIKETKKLKNSLKSNDTYE